MHDYGEKGEVEWGLVRARYDMLSVGVGFIGFGTSDISTGL